METTQKRCFGTRISRWGCERSLFDTQNHHFGRKFQKFPGNFRFRGAEGRNRGIRQFKIGFEQKKRIITIQDDPQNLKYYVREKLS